MAFKKEQIFFAPGFPFAMYETNARQVMIHCHDCLEVNLIKKGCGHYLIENHTYGIRENDIFIINNSEHHMAVHEEELSMLVFVFSPEFVWSSPEEFGWLKPFFERGATFSNTVDQKYQGFEKMKELLLTIAEEYEKQAPGWELMIKSLLMLFLARLNRYYQGREELEEDRGQMQGYSRIRHVIEYIHENFARELTLSQLSELAAMGKSYFSSYFTNTMKMTVFAYIEQVRVNHAAMELITTSNSILEIALEAGFHSSSYFNRVFKKVMKMTPSAYRKSKDSTILEK